jgi:hypothetical protein
VGWSRPAPQHLDQLLDLGLAVLRTVLLVEVILLLN